jgi:hypothetical protein
MSLADAIPVVTAARAEREATRAAARTERDAFIQPAFAAMTLRFEALLAEALGLHSRIAMQTTSAVQAVTGRTFATLTVRTTVVRSTLLASPQVVTFTPQLDFREPDQFGLIACAIDFPFVPGRARGDVVARALTERGIQMRGKTTASLLLPVGHALVELTARDLEAAFAAWWLR